MRALNFTSFFIGVCLSGSAMGCAFTIPTPPQLSKSTTKEGLSSSGRLIAEAAGQTANKYVPSGDSRNGEGAIELRNSVAADIMRCEKRLNESVNKMNLQRTAKTGLTIVGASLSTCAGIAAAILTRSPLVSDSQTATAIVAAGGGLVTIVTQAIGDPAGELQNYQRNLEHYNRAIAMAERIRLSNEAQFYDIPDCKKTSIAETPECLSLEKQAVETALGRYEAWQATEIRALAAELRACTDTQSSTVVDEPKSSDRDSNGGIKPLLKMPTLPQRPSSTGGIPPVKTDKTQ